MCAASSFAIAGTAHASPIDDVIGSVPGTSSSALDIGQILQGIPGISDLLGSGGAVGSTRCESVVQVGDSTSVGVDDASHVPSAGDVLSAQYKRVGAKDVTLDADGGRSIVEKVNDHPNADEAVRSLIGQGKKGCWVIAMGVNDAANISVGSTVNADDRIDRILKQLSGQPVVWPTVTTSNQSVKGYDAAAMSSFNAALRRATTRYPNLAVYDWASAAKPEWFADGIHYTSAGTAERNKRFADALAVAYPTGAGSAPAKVWVPA